MRAPLLTFKRARALRRAMTLPEVVLWQALRGARLDGLGFRRQHPMGPYVLDFYCPSVRLAVEIEGVAHLPEQAEHDARRRAWLAARGVRVLRFLAADVLKDERLEGVLETIAAEAAVPAPAPSTALRAVPLPRREATGEEP
jgi:very-short-patch-repair endonuclease